jgi:hypothetical protein
MREEGEVAGPERLTLRERISADRNSYTCDTAAEIFGIELNGAIVGQGVNQSRIDG